MTIPIPAVGSTGWDVSVDAVINRVNELDDIETDIAAKLATADAPELIRDTMGTALVAGSNITITPDDGANTITVAGQAGYTDEQVRDVIAAALVAGSNVTITPNDGADTITIAASGGGGSPAPVNLTDAAPVALDASLGEYFRLAATTDRTISVPTNPTDGQAITIEHLASGGARTLTLTTGSAGAFKFGTTITALSQTTSGARDLIRAIYNSTAARWYVVGYVKGL